MAEMQRDNLIRDGARAPGLLRQALMGVFIAPRATLRAWYSADPDAITVLLRLTLPMILFSVTAAAWAHAAIPSPFPAATRPDPLAFAIYSALTQLTGVLALAAMGHFLCDLFCGRSDFRRALAAVSVALVPAWVANVAAALPWPWGAHLGLAGILYSLVLLYAAFAIILGVTRGDRLGHYCASLGGAALVTFAVGWQLVSLIPGAAPATRLGTTWLI